MEKILVRVPNWIGDAVLCLPALEALKNHFLDSYICVLAKPWVADLFKDQAAIDNLMIYQRPGAHQGLIGFIKLVKEIKAPAFDSAILFQNAFEAAFLAFSARIPKRIGYKRDGRGWLLTEGVYFDKNKAKNHQVYYYLDLLKVLGIKIAKSENSIKPKIILKESDFHATESILKKIAYKNSDLLIGLHPSAAFGPAKCWSLEKFKKLAQKLISEFRSQILIFGSSSEAPFYKDFEAINPSIYNLAGQTDLRQLAVLFKKCSLLIANDSGLMHLASAVNTPVVAIFGSTDPKATGPLGDNHQVIWKAGVSDENLDLACSPCFKRACPEGHYKCLEYITVTEVFESVCSLIKVTHEFRKK